MDKNRRYVSRYRRFRVSRPLSLDVFPGRFLRNEVHLKQHLAYRHFLSTTGRFQERKPPDQGGGMGFDRGTESSPIRKQAQPKAKQRGKFGVGVWGRLMGRTTSAIGSEAGRSARSGDAGQAGGTTLRVPDEHLLVPASKRALVPQSPYVQMLLELLIQQLPQLRQPRPWRPLRLPWPCEP